MITQAGTAAPVDDCDPNDVNCPKGMITEIYIHSHTHIYLRSNLDLYTFLFCM